MTEISFGINGCSDVLAQSDGRMVVLYIKSDDGEGMIEVDYTEFMEFFKKLAFVAVVSWNEELVKEYRQFYKDLEELLKKVPLAENWLGGMICGD